MKREDITSFSHEKEDVRILVWKDKWYVMMLSPYYGNESEVISRKKKPPKKLNNDHSEEVAKHITISECTK